MPSGQKLISFFLRNKKHNPHSKKKKLDWGNNEIALTDREKTKKTKKLTKHEKEEEKTLKPRDRLVIDIRLGIEREKPEAVFLFLLLLS